ncbi:MAG: hypothetical protein E6Q44_08395 [Flavobacteriales bacterium]|nr:MAG: hypothetical protein E6Q44_08395 [Flavobacteriales bacterium]
MVHGRPARIMRPHGAALRLAGMARLALLAAWAQGQYAVPLDVPSLHGMYANCLAQDDLGALWIGTDGGLLRFDGAATETYVSDPLEEHSLPHDNILDLLPADDGMLWAATSGGVLAVHTHTGRRWRVPFLQHGKEVHLEPLHLTGSHIGHWAFCGTAGLYKWAPGDSVYRPVPTSGTPALVRAGGGWEAPDSSLWYVDRMAVRHWIPQEQREEVFPCRPFGKEAPPKTLLLDLQPDRFHQELLWVNTWGLGLIAFNRRTHTFTTHVAREPLSDLHNVALSMAQVDTVHWYVAMDDALQVLEVRPEGSTFRTESLGDPVRSVHRTRDGSLLIGGFAQVWSERPAPATVKALGHELGLSSVHAIGALDGDGYWAVRFYRDRKLMRLAPDGSLRYAIPLPADSLPYEAFQIVQTRDSVIWLGTTRGLMRHRPGTRTVDPVALDQTMLRSPRAPVTDLLVDDRDHLWALFAEQHIMRMAAGTREQRYTEARGQDAIGMAVLDEDRLIVAHRNAPPELVDRRTLELRAMALPEVPPAAFAQIEGVVVQADGKPVLHAYGFGLTRLHDPGHNDRWTIDRTWRPYGRPAILHALCDRQGRLWCSSERGGILLDPATDLLNTLDAKHGVNSHLTGQMALMPNGDILACGNPYVLFSKDHGVRLTDAPLVWRQVIAGGTDRTATAVMSGTIILPADSAMLNLQFGRVALYEGNAFHYAYRIRGSDPDQPWVELGTQRSVSLGALEAGDHLLELRSESAMLPTATITLQLQVLPAWWAQWWFRAIVLVAVLAAAVLATRQVLAQRLRSKEQELERQRELEHVRLRIARDVHDGIGSGLTKITMMLRNMPGTDREQAQRIAQASSELVHELGEIVWTVDPRNDDVATFVAFVRSTLGRQAEGIPLRLVSDLRFDPSMARATLPPDVKRNVLLVMREAVNNAFKHSAGDHIDVGLSITTKALMLTVNDNGNGFDPERASQRGNGLHNFHKRAEELGGTVRVESSPNGSTIVLQVPMSPTNMEARPV